MNGKWTAGIHKRTQFYDLPLQDHDRGSTGGQQKNYIVPHLFLRNGEETTAYWKHRGRQNAFDNGMKPAHLPCSGQYEWVTIQMYWGVEIDYIALGYNGDPIICDGRFKKLPLGKNETK